MSDRSARVVLVILLLIAGLRVGSTWPVFNQTNDEHVHIALGMEWLERGTYTGEPQHPPLARIAAAVGPFLDGIRFSKDVDSLLEQGNAILYSGSYLRTLSLARAGTLPFFLLSIVVVWLHGRMLGGNLAAVFAAAVYSNLPPVLAHAGLATTDMAVTCGIALTLLLLQRWVLAPTFRVAALLGLGTAIALVSKFSALLFLPVGAAAIMAVTSLGRRDRLVRQLLVVAVACFLVTWSVYRFSFARLSGHHYDIVQVWVETHPRLAAVGPYVGAVPLPMPELFAGIAQTFIHNGWGHEGYLFGETSKRGWWFYFPTAIAVKTPIAFLLLSLAAPLIVGRRDRIWLGPLLAALAITIASLFTNINIGVRHVLPVYPLLAVSSGCALAMLWPRRRTLVTLVLLTEAIVSARAHPDYLAYFNAFAGREPHRVLADSNLDWGQDLLRLASRTRERDVDALHLLYYGNADPQRHGLPPLRPPVAGDPGWWAVSETHIALFRDQTAWLDRYPYERVGTSFRLYRVPGGTAVTTRP